MAPKSRPSQIRGGASQSTFGAIVSEIKNPENRPVIKSILLFGAAVAFFSSPLAEMINPGV
ncbi:hypothetical protein BJ508DRAFT_411875 [Ascobolus immersus RN42]|uniref:Uncharacterized protein n=1 Tax=Ascobolus immersus RN42 TaxID=1160509 RepID=A0A3N4IMV3_ASCIM|nr:hypothetical protein BJ508DRAFT_411875 [Ascobolus immersus RN42]